MIKAKDLMHGDVLLYEYRKEANPTQQGIKWVEGSCYVHCSIVWKIARILYILEQLNPRIHSILDFYQPYPGEVIHCYRPKFTIPEQDEKTMFRRDKYGYLIVVDEAINHFLRFITFQKWTFRPMLSKLFKYKLVDCSTLVAMMLNLKIQTLWCRYPEVVEPDDYAKHPEDLMYIGIVDWS